MATRGRKPQSNPDCPSQSEIARHVFLTPGRVSQLRAASVIPKGCTLDEAREAYIKHLRGLLDRGSEKDRLDRARADEIEMRLEVQRGDLVRADDVQSGLARVFSELKTRLRAIPVRLAPIIVGDSRMPVIEAKLSDAIDDSLRALAVDLPGVAREGFDRVDAAAEADDKPVGRRKPKA